MFQLHQKWCLLLQLATEKKTSFSVQLKQIVGPYYFVRAVQGVQWQTFMIEFALTDKVLIKHSIKTGYSAKIIHISAFQSHL